MKKKAEFFWRTSVLQNDKDEISCVHSQNYGQRFANFMKYEVIIDNDETEEQRRESVTNSSRDSINRSMKGRVVNNTK